MSGVGEASFVCIAPPWIAKYAPDGRKGRWLAIFYTALPVGTAFGYSYAAFIANFMGVHWAFFMESMAILPLIAILLRLAPYYPGCPSPHFDPDEQFKLSNALDSQDLSKESQSSVDPALLNPLHKSSDEVETEKQTTDTTDSTAVKYDKSSQHIEAPTLLQELYTVSSSTSYVCITAGATT